MRTSSPQTSGGFLVSQISQPPWVVFYLSGVFYFRPAHSRSVGPGLWVLSARLREAHVQAQAFCPQLSGFLSLTHTWSPPAAASCFPVFLPWVPLTWSEHSTCRPRWPWWHPSCALGFKEGLAHPRPWQSPVCASESPESPGRLTLLLRPLPRDAWAGRGLPLAF